jgi:hypothetical protein
MLSSFTSLRFSLKQHVPALLDLGCAMYIASPLLPLGPCFLPAYGRVTREIEKSRGLSIQEEKSAADLGRNIGMLKWWKDG